MRRHGRKPVHGVNLERGMNMTYSIPEMNMESLEKKLTRIANKAKKYGCDFHYEKLGEHYEERTLSEEIGWDSAENRPIYHHYKVTIKYIDIEVSGLAAVNGWKFAASLEYHENGNIINGTGEVEIPQRYYACKPWCEHCRTQRDRAYSYIVYNEESGEFKQVGKSCLRDFTGGLSAERVAQYEQWLKEAEEAQTGGGSWWSREYFDTLGYMTFVAEAIRAFGYYKRDGRNTSTADRAEVLFRHHNGMRLSDSKEHRAQIAESETRGFDPKNPASAELAATVRDWIVNNERDDNYFHNLKVACSERVTSPKNIGLLASAFPAYDRELEREAERRAREAAEAEARAQSSWMGEVGERVSFEIADCRCISSWETQWGYTSVYKFVSVDGLQATWKTSSYVNLDKSVGKVLTGTVKEQKEYRGIKQTELTRCKITEKAS